MKKTAKTRKTILVLCLILIAFITHTYFFNKGSLKQKYYQLEVEKTEEEYTKKIMEQKSIMVKRIAESISSEVEIVVLKENGRIKLFHDKTPKNNKYIEWVIDSNISLNVYYTAILTINTDSIKVSYDSTEDKINIVYDIDKIEIKAINIDNILSETNKGIFGEKYSENEVTALTLVATDRIKEEIAKDKGLKYLASMNLESYLRNLSYQLGVFNVNVFQK